MSLTATNAQVYKGTAAVTYGGGPGDPTTVLLMHCDGTNGSTSFIDSSSYNATLSSLNSAQVSTSTTKIGTGSLYLPNSGTAYVQAASSSSYALGTGNFTIEFWMNWSGVYSSSGNGWQRVISNKTGAFATNTWIIGWDNLTNNGTAHLAFQAFNIAGTPFYSATTIITSGSWNHYAFVRNGSNFYVFCNGSLQNSYTSIGTTAIDDRAACPLTIGGNPGDSQYFYGYLDEIRVTNGVALYTSNFTPATLQFTPLNTTTLSLPGTNNNYMLLPPTHPVNYDPSTSNVFVEAWVYWNGANWTATNGGAIYEKENVGSTVQDFGLYVDGSVAKLTAYMYTQNGSILRPIYNTALNVKQWYHVAFGYNTVNQTAYVWVNGTVGTTSTASNPARYSVTYTFIGNNPFNIPSTYAWNGYIQDLRVTRGGTIPTTSFTPAAAPFGLASPSYVSGGTTVLSLATQYYQTTATGLLPQVFLAPSGTYPSYTTTSAPVFNSTNVAFTGAGFSAGNFINFGQTTITMALGYSIVFQFAWTGSYQSAYERIFDFGVAGGNSNAIIVYRNGTGSTINFGNFTGTSAQTITSTSTFPQNTDSGTVVCVYDPASTGSLKMYVNGSLQATLNGITIIPNGSFPSSLIAKSNATGSDPFSNVSIYSMKFYNRVLSAAEIARTASPISSIQFTSRPILPAVLTNPGAQTFTIGGTVTVAQTALEPANGITWSLAPTGQGVSVASSTDYALTLSTAASVTQNLFTVSATNKAGLTTVTQFTGATPILNQISSGAAASVVGIYSLRALGSLYSRVVQIRSSGFVYPPIAMTSDNFTASGTYNGVTNGVYISSASSAWGGSEFPFSAFDKNFNASRWTTSSSPYNGTTGAYGGGFSTTISGSAYSGEWLQLKVPSATVITSYTIYTSSFDPQRTPVDFKVAGSNDGTTWTVIDTQTGITSWLSSSTSLTFTVTSSPPAYLYFRLVTNKNGGTGSNGYLSIGEWVINNVPANTDFYADTLGNLTTAAGSGQTLSSWLGAATGFVTTWYDQSGKGSHMSCSSTALQPKIDLVNKWIDFKTTAYFDTSATPTTGPVPYSNAKRYTVICKYNSMVDGGGICGVSNAAPNFNTTSYTNNFRRGGTGFYNYWFFNDILGGTYGVGNSVTFKWDGTNRYIYTNSSLVTTQASSGWLQTSSSSQMIGKTTADMTMNGEMYYIYMFDTALSDADRLIMESIPIS